MTEAVNTTSVSARVHDAAAPILRIDDLRVTYRTSAGEVDAVRGVTFAVQPGETVAIVGESGSGKSTTAHAVLRMLATNATIAGGSVEFESEDLTEVSDKRLRALRGQGIGLVPQDPTVSLNPTMRIGDQVAEVLTIHGLATRSDASERAVEALATAGISEPEVRARQYPHELSGGMRQRVLIAIAIIARPRLLIADEPTSALDVTVQRQILDHLDDLKRELGMSILLITHDLGVAGDRADRLVVMSQGRVVEHGDATEVLTNPQHEYTRQLLAAAPSLHLDDAVVAPSQPLVAWVQDPDVDAGPEPERAPLVAVESISKTFARRGGGVTRAVDGVSFEIPEGETLGIVGESGSGKSTSARLVLRLDDPDSGRITFGGDDITNLGGGKLRQLRRRMQLVHQNPYASLNPRQSIGDIIAEPLDAFRVGSRQARRARVLELLDLVALPKTVAQRRPAELSGGQRQRVAIARALAISPELVVLDEAVSALDVSVQHQILTLLVDIQRDLGVSYLFISHDLAVVRHIAHRVVVMQHGRVVESGAVDRVFDRPEAAYTRMLLDAIPGRRLEHA